MTEAGLGDMATENHQEKNLRGRMVGGIILTGLGLLFLLNNLDVIDFQDSWPLVLIIVGLSLLVGAFAQKKTKAPDGF
jgi:putative Mn2+ efflux pump MntP